MLSFRDAIEADFSALDIPLSLAIVYEGSGGPASSNLQAIRDQQTSLGLRSDIYAFETMGLPRSDGVHLTSLAAQQVGSAMAAGLPVPEPSCLSLLLMGLSVAGLFRRR